MNVFFAEKGFASLNALSVYGNAKVIFIRLYCEDIDWKKTKIWDKMRVELVWLKEDWLRPLKR